MSSPVGQKRFLLSVLSACLLCSFHLQAQVSYQRLLRADEQPHNWLTYNGTYSSQRYSTLDEVTPANVASLESKWVLQNRVFGAWQTNPLVVDGIMYLTQRPNDVIALDAKTGRVFWQYEYTPSKDAKVCCGANNRGVAILGDTLFMGTLDAHLVAVDATNGHPLWDVEIADVNLAYSITMAPLIVKDKVIVGVGGGEYGIRGFIAAYDAQSGEQAWRFHTIPGPGEPGHDTWSGNAWEHGGGSVWVTGSYDPALNLTYWGGWQPCPRLECRPASWRQSLHRICRGTQRRYRRPGMALSIHSERWLRLRLGSSPSTRRHGVERRAQEVDVVG